MWQQVQDLFLDGDDNNNNSHINISETEWKEVLVPAQQRLWSLLEEYLGNLGSRGQSHYRERLEAGPCYFAMEEGIQIWRQVELHHGGEGIPCKIKAGGTRA